MLNILMGLIAAITLSNSEPEYIYIHLCNDMARSVTLMSEEAPQFSTDTIFIRNVSNMQTGEIIGDVWFRGERWTCVTTKIQLLILEDRIFSLPEADTGPTF